MKQLDKVKSYYISGLVDDLHYYVIAYKFVEDIQNALKKNYDIEEVGAKKIMSHYFKYQRSDEKYVET